MSKLNVSLAREMTEAWIDSKANKLFEFSSYIDEKGWNTQAIDRVEARKFILSFLEELQDSVTSIAKEAYDRGYKDSRQYCGFELQNTSKI